MARDYSPKHLVEIVLEGGTIFARQCWYPRKRGVVPGYGAPNAANLKKFVRQFALSLEPHGPNSHLREGPHPVGDVIGGRIIENCVGNDLVVEASL